MPSTRNHIEVWNHKVKDAVNSRAAKKLGMYRAAYRNEENKVIYENITFSSVLEAVVNSTFKIPSLTVEVDSFDKSKNVLSLFRNAYRSKILLEQFVKRSKFKIEITKCVVESKVGHWGIMEIVRDKESKLGYDLKHRSSLDLITDPEGRDHDLSDSRWIAFEFVKHKDVLKEDKSLKNAGDLQGNYNPKFGDPEFVKRKLTEPLGLKHKNPFTDLVRGWEIFDIDNRKRLKIIDSKGEAIWEEDWDIDLPRFPFITLWYHFNMDRQLPIAPASNIGIIEKEVNDLKHFRFNHARKISRTIWPTRKGAFDAKTKILMEESSKDLVAEVKKGSTADSIVQLKEKTVGFEFTAAIQDVKSWLSSLGQGLIDSRNFGTAAEPNIISSNAQKIGAWEASRVEEFVSVVLSSFLKLIQKDSKGFIIPLNRSTFINTLRQSRAILEEEPMSQEDAQLFIGESVSLEDIAAKDPEGKFIIQEGKMLVTMPFVSINKENIKGDFMVSVDRGSMGLESLQVVTGIYSLFKEDSFINQSALRKIVLGAFENSEIRALLRPEQDVRSEAMENQQRRVQAELAEPRLKKQADLEKTQVKIASNE